jgi:serine/threonine protein kinase
MGRILAPHAAYHLLAPQAMSLESETRLGPYEIVSPLGAGGMGEVYKARDGRLGRTVAVKVLPEATAGDPSFRARFEREARGFSRFLRMAAAGRFQAVVEPPRGGAPTDASSFTSLRMES